MPIPFVFIALGAGAAAVGVGKGVKAGIDQKDANETNKYAQSIVERATNTAMKSREKIIAFDRLRACLKRSMM